MKNLLDFALEEKYSQVKKLRSRLEEMNELFDWDAFVSLFPKRETTIGRPNYDKKLMIKCLMLQSWYSLSDPELEFQIYDRLSFQQFLDFPKSIPDYSTIWKFREELIESDIIDRIWDEQKRQLAQHDIEVKEGKIQDATFIHADPGKKNSGMDDRQMAKTSRSKDGSWTKKNGKSIFGFKSHTKMQKGSKFIEEVAVTTAKVHDNNIDLADEDDIIYRDKGYTGTKTKAKGDGTMLKRKNSTIREKLRNIRIQKKRAEGEHPYGTIKRSFKGGFTKLTTIPRVFVQQVFVCIAYNVHRLRFLVNG